MTALELLLTDFSKDASFRVEPCDTRFMATVTVYPNEQFPERKYLALGDNARAALEAALMKAQEAWL